jgi:hypothetical protein
MMLIIVEHHECLWNRSVGGFKTTPYKKKDSDGIPTVHGKPFKEDVEIDLCDTI